MKLLQYIFTGIFLFPISLALGWLSASEPGEVMPFTIVYFLLFALCMAVGLKAPKPEKRKKKPWGLRKFFTENSIKDPVHCPELNRKKRVRKPQGGSSVDYMIYPLS